jgi:hypothetical protein
MTARAKSFHAASLVLAVALGGCGGCGGDDKLDSGKLERDLKSSLEKTTRAKIGDVSCPSDIAVKEGQVTTCTTSNAAGDKIRIRVTQTDTSGHVRYVVG